MMGDQESKAVMCCFSGDWIDIDQAIRMVIFIPNSDETQVVFSKPSELVKLFVTELPIHPDLLDLAHS